MYCKYNLEGNINYICNKLIIKNIQHTKPILGINNRCNFENKLIMYKNCKNSIICIFRAFNLQLKGSKPQHTYWSALMRIHSVEIHIPTRMISRLEIIWNTRQIHKAIWYNSVEPPSSHTIRCHIQKHVKWVTTCCKGQTNLDPRLSSEERS